MGALSQGTDAHYKGVRFPDSDCRDNIMSYHPSSFMTVSRCNCAKRLLHKTPFSGTSQQKPHMRRVPGQSEALLDFFEEGSIAPQ